MKILKRLAYGFLGLILLLAIWIAANSIDDAELSEQAKEMLTPVPEVPAEENGYEVISYLDSKDFKVFDKDDSEKVAKIVKGEIWDADFATRLVTEKKKVIDDVIAATQKPRFKFPARKKALDLPNYEQISKAMNLLILKANLEWKSFSIDSATTDLGTSVNFCQKIMDDENHFLISYMLGTSCLSRTINSIHELSTTQRLDKNQRAKLTSLLKIIHPYTQDGFEKIFSGELRFIESIFHEDAAIPKIERLKKVYKNSGNGGEIFEYANVLFPKYYTHPKHLINTESEHLSLAISDTGHYCDAVQSIKKYGHIQPDFDLETNVFIPAGMKKIGSFYYYAEYFESRCLAYSYFDAVSAIIAIHAYQQDHDNLLPQDLNELVPEYMDKLPIDYFNGEPLKYSRENKWLYSVGTDYQDDKGSALGYTRGRCYQANDKNRCDTNPTFPIDWNDYPASVR